ncbi:hypothetical protein MSMTP_0592 [Methanosarcina sp. MTP4]|nr:hypothetical protein MSMTP_0592 [Methanosarcina sp. MTP4]
MKFGTTKPGGPKVDSEEECPEDKYICIRCYDEFMNLEEELEKD